MKTFRQDIRFLWALMRHHEKYILKLRKWIFYWQKQKRIHQEIRMQCEISLFVSQKCINTEVFKFFKISKKYKEIKIKKSRWCLPELTFPIRPGLHYSNIHLLGLMIH